MKRLFTLLFIVTATMSLANSCAASERKWLKDYGIDPSCTNPVFTKPHHTVPGGRVQGAGICMDDGEAYTHSSYVGLSSEWHYAPKLSYCAEEAATIYKVCGGNKQAFEMRNGDDEAGLKFAVRPINGCGAFVVYRNTRAQWGKYDHVEQYIATYDGEGKLIDAMLMGYEDDGDDLFAVTPHGNYESPDGWRMRESLNWLDENHFTIERTINYADPARPNRTVWDTKVIAYYSITPGNHIRLERINYDNEMPEINPLALRTLEVMLRPWADSETHKLFAKLQRDANGNERLAPTLELMSRLLANWNDNNKKSSKK